MNNLTDDTLLEMSETGFTNVSLALEYIKHFDKHTRQPKHPKRKRLLLMDGHWSHGTYQFMKYCDDNGIIPFTFPSHSTNLLQPLDIGIFQSYRHYHQEYLTDHVVWGGANFGKADFLSTPKDARPHFLEKSYFFFMGESRAAPVNPNIVLQNMEIFNPPKPPSARPFTLKIRSALSTSPQLSSLSTTLNDTRTTSTTA